MMKQDVYDAVMDFVRCRRCKCCPRDDNVEDEDAEAESGPGPGPGRLSDRQFSDMLFMLNGRGLSSDTLRAHEEPHVGDDDDDDDDDVD
jgi:hypothetical protein